MKKKKTSDFYGETASPGGVETIIGKGSTLKGDVKMEHSLRVDGSIRGRVITKSNIYLGKGGEIEGEIFVHDALIGGKFKGKLDAAGVAHLLADSYFQGELKAGKLIIEDGAIFEGVCSMGQGSQRELSPSMLKMKPHKALVKPEQPNNGEEAH